jgi:hypothetical protein
MKIKTNFKFGRPYDFKDFELFDPSKFNLIDWPQISNRRRAYRSPSIDYCYEPKDSHNGYDQTPPQKDLRTIKKFHYKGKYPKPRNN